MATKKKLYRKLKSKYRLVVMNDETFEEKASVILSPLNVLIIASITALILVGFGVVIIAFTPLREYIPGYMDVSLSKKLVKSGLRLDSLEQAMVLKDRYITNINRIIMGDKMKSDKKDENIPVPSGSASIPYYPKDLLLGTLIFFTPVHGYVSNPYNPATRHYGVDIATADDEPVKSVLDGTVIFTGWTSETGYVINVQHEQNLVSVYKHNSMLVKKEGDPVKAGDVISFSGQAGELSTGPHLHFELWYRGQTVNPMEYVKF
ncbi:MAG: M23 family metallopeptidase [Bacteroidetes bacterium]|nr:M23 family metallopeptidase [Bacteroidota bacterium]